jgi:hypothetical protein
MPFIANHNGEMLNALVIPKDTFLELRDEPLSCPCCVGSMHVRIPEARAQHFAHDPGYRAGGDCELRGGGVSENHAAVQALVYNAINRRGPWEGHLEFSGEGWRADVFADRPDTLDKRSFEVQFSGIEQDKVRTRTDRHRQSGVSQTTWLWARDYPWMYSEVPSVRLEVPAGWDHQSDINVSFRGLPRLDQRGFDDFSVRTVPLSRFIGAVLLGKLQARKDDEIAVPQGRRPYVAPGSQWLFQSQHEIGNHVNEVMVSAIEAKERRNWLKSQRDDAERLMQEAMRLQRIRNHNHDREDVSVEVQARHPDVIRGEGFDEHLAYGCRMTYRGKRIVVQPMPSKISREKTPWLFDGAVTIVCKSAYSKEYLMRLFPNQLTVCSWEELKESGGLDGVY